MLKMVIQNKPSLTWLIKIQWWKLDASVAFCKQLWWKTAVVCAVYGSSPQVARCCRRQLPRRPPSSWRTRPQRTWEVGVEVIDLFKIKLYVVPCSRKFSKYIPGYHNLLRKFLNSWHTVTLKRRFHTTSLCCLLILKLPKNFQVVVVSWATLLGEKSTKQNQWRGGIYLHDLLK